MVLKIGVLSLQGAFLKHRKMLDLLGIPSIEVRTQEDLMECEGLIIPGGESSTMNILNELNLTAFQCPIFGTCAGLILMTQLGFFDVTIERNAYGRQSQSFAEDLQIFLDKPHTVRAIFIRAPRIQSIRSEKVKVLADTPVIIQQGHYFATTFHPELTNDPTIHHYFVQLCKKKQLLQQPSKAIPTKSFQMT